MVHVKGRLINAVARIRPSMLPIVTGPVEVVFFTIVIPWHGPPVEEKLQHQGKIIVPDLHPVTGFFNQARKKGLQVISPPFFKLKKKIRGPADNGSRSLGSLQVRFIGKDTHEGGAKIFTVILFVPLHGCPHKSIGNPRIKKIDIRKSSIPV